MSELATMVKIMQTPGDYHRIRVHASNGTHFCFTEINVNEPMDITAFREQLDKAEQFVLRNLVKEPNEKETTQTL